MSADGAGSDDAAHVRDELRRQRDDLQMILDALPAFVFYKDTNNRILRANRAVAESLGVEVADLVDTETARWYPEEAARYYADDLEVIESGKAKRGIIEPLDTGREKRWIATDKLPQFGPDGRVERVVVIAQDITERRALEHDLAQAQKLDSIGRLAGGVAHDFNNLLTSIMGHLSVARDALPPDSPVLDDLDAVWIAAERGADLTRQLLGFARKQRIEPRVLHLPTVARESRQLLARIIQANIEVRIDVVDEDTWVRMDPGQLSQVIMNLTLNARDAMPSGGVVTLSVRRVQIDEGQASAVSGLRPGSCAKLSVVDTGTGFAPEALPHLFEPFFTTKAKGQGTGLGLATCYGIVKQNAGHIVAHNNAPNVGATFDVYLPAVARADAHIATPVPAAPPPLLTGRTVLLAEDEGAVRALCVRLLERAGCHVIAAANGTEALSKAGAHEGTIDLLLSDIEMPQMGGIELCQRFGALHPTTAVLFMSGYPESALTTGTRMSRGVDLIAKPFRPDDLLARITAALTRTHRSLR